MYNSPSYVSKSAQKPYIPFVHDNLSHLREYLVPNKLENIRDKLREKPLTPIQSKGYGGSGLKSIDSSFQNTSLRKPQPQVVNDLDISASSSGIYEKIQSIQSQSVQTLEDEERILLKSIQFDVRHAIQKYQSKIRKSPTKLFLKVQYPSPPKQRVQPPTQQDKQRERDRINRVQQVPPAQDRSFVVSADKRKKNGRQSESKPKEKDSKTSLIERKKSLQIKSIKDQRSDEKIALKLYSPEQTKLRGGSKKNKENHNNSTHISFRGSAGRKNFFSIQEVVERSSSQKKKGRGSTQKNNTAILSYSINLLEKRDKGKAKNR